MGFNSVFKGLILKFKFVLVFKAFSDGLIHTNIEMDRPNPAFEGPDGNFPTCIPDGHLRRVTYTRCCIDTTDSPGDEHKVVRNM